MEFLTGFFILFIFIIFYLMISQFREYIEREKRRKYHDALNIFFEWKKEIGGVSLKGVGQNYEKWIWKKIEFNRMEAKEKTTNKLRKDHE